jgi:glutamate-1-semialdehyde aminotransferase
VRDVATRIGAVLIVDEITAAFRMNVGGAHLRYGLVPDLAAFAKGISNGFPMAALIGRDEVMEAAQRTFISSTYWTERTGPAAALATIRKLRDRQVPEHLCRVGNRMREGWEQLARRHRLAITVKGLPPLSAFSLDHGADAIALSTLFTQEMLEQGFLASKAFYATWAHQPEHVDAYLAAADRAFASMRAALDAGDVAGRLRGPMQHTGFHRLA